MVGQFRGIAGGFCALALVSACGSTGSSESDVVLLAQDGPFEGTLAIEPNPPHVGLHRVVITLDEGSEPLEGAAVMISPWMPAHGHGSTDVEAVEEAPGVYASDEVWFNMPGVWDLRVHVHAGDAGELIATVEVP